MNTQGSPLPRRSVLKALATPLCLHDEGFANPSAATTSDWRLEA